MCDVGPGIEGVRLNCATFPGASLTLGLVAKQEGDKDLDWTVLPQKLGIGGVPTCSLARATDDVFFSAMMMFD